MIGPTIDDAARRARLVDRHHLAGDASGPEQAAADVVVLHATDPATVYLSVLSRCRAADLADVARALYRDRTLVRLMAMRRTLFVAPTSDAPVVHHGASLEIAAMTRKRLLSQLVTLPTEPAVPVDPAAADDWLREVEDATVAALAELGTATGAQLAAAVPGLRTAFLPTTQKGYDVQRFITSQVLTSLGAQGRMVRGEPRGSWTSRHHTWEPAATWWPDGIEPLDPSAARVELVRAYLARFGPATETDVAWWTGWTKGQTRAAIGGTGAETVEVATGPAYVLDGGDEPAATDPSAALLPALDPTPMGWKERDWFLPAEAAARGVLYDRFGNVGPTIWWAGEVVGGWAVRPDGTVVTRLLADRGAACVAATAAEAARLTERLAAHAVVPSFQTPLEKELRTGS